MGEANIMTYITGVLMIKRMAKQLTKFSGLLILMLLVSLFCLPIAGFTAQDSPIVTELKQKASHAYIDGHYAEAVAANLEVAEKYPESEARRYAVQMLGTIYEDNIVDIKKAVKWDREFLNKYADSRQVSFYTDKIASLEKMLNQEQAFTTYQNIRFANKGDEFIVKQFERLLKDHPDFLLKADVERELGHAYSRMDKRKQSVQAFQALSKTEGNKLSQDDQIAVRTAQRYWQMTWVWALVAWAVIGALWAVVLFMKPWKQLDRAAIRKFLLWPVLWVILTAASMPLFYSLETTGYPIVIPDTAIFLAIGLNLIILFWLFLLTRGKFWQTRPRALRWLAPVLTMLMTTAVFYLFVIYQPDGPYMTDVFGVKYQYWMGELRERRLPK
jgi:tetratricopeptide (TPR) repeat protein